MSPLWETHLGKIQLGVSGKGLLIFYFKTALA